jgi:hypothetical protein
MGPTQNETATRVFQFINNLNTIDGNRTDPLELFTYTVLKGNVEPLSTGVRSLLTDFNLSFDDIKPSEKALPPDVVKHLSRPGQTYPGTLFAQTQHAVYTEQGEPTGDTVWLDMDEDESLGTQKVYHLAGPVVDTLANGKVLLIDEVGASMHTELTLKLIGLFLNPEINTKGAQLIFCTHDTNLLQYSPLRPDQIYFTEKAHNRATQLYSLADFEHDAERNGPGKPDYEKPYLEGLYGGILFFGDFSKLASLSRQPK